MISIMPGKAGEAMKRITFITGNDMKAKESMHILKNFGIEMIREKLEVEEIQEKDAGRVSARKALDVYKELKKPIIVEDTGLYIKAMNDYPGALIKHFFNSIGPEGIVDFLKGKQRPAEAVTAVAYCDSEENVKTFIGRVKGSISTEVRIKNNFDWDNIFIPQGYHKTYSLFTMEEKNEISQRRKAMEKFARWFISK